MGASTLSAALRITLGLALVAFALGAGILQRSPAILPFMGAGFTAAYLFGQLRLWRVARERGALKQYWQQLPADFTLQLVLVAVLYLVGFGLSALFSGGVSLQRFGPGDAIWPLAVGAAASIMGLYVDRLEGKPSSFVPSWLTPGGDEADDLMVDQLRVLPGRVSVESFYMSHLPDPPAGLSEDEITCAEARIGRALPDTLIDLYHRQNGGQVASLCIPLPGIEEPRSYGDVLAPFSGLGELVPAGSLRTLKETVRDYADQGHPGDDIAPQGAGAMIVLAQWRRETLFLDYNRPGAPRVGFADFAATGPDGEPNEITWWADFEVFFAALRHYEQV